MDRVEYQSLIIQDLLNLEEKGELNTTPWYQRRSVWNHGQKSYLVNTLFEKKPVPALYIRHSLDLDKGKSIKEVVDGQQRSRTIIKYLRDEFKARHPSHDRLVLYSELTKSQKQEFLLTSLPIGYLLGATDADVIDIFARINSVSKTLNAQEKRNALFSGEFKQFCVHNAASRIEFWKNYNLFSGNDIARMNEVQFISDLSINLVEGLTDYSAKKIDRYYRDNDEDFPNKQSLQRRLDRVFNTLIKLDANYLKQTVFNRLPLFFSLFLILDSIPIHNIKEIENGINEIDNRFNSDKPSPEDTSFIAATSATTQRITQRKVRDQYIRQYIK